MARHIRASEPIWGNTLVHDRQIGNGSNRLCDNAWEKRQRQREGEDRVKMHGSGTREKGRLRKPMRRREETAVFYMAQVDTHRTVICR